MAAKLTDHKALIFDVYGTLCVRDFASYGRSLIINILGLGNGAFQRAQTTY